MTTTQTAPFSASGPIDIGDVAMWVERRGDGPDVLLIAGLGDPAEAWQFQLDGLADRYRVTAFDNRGAGRTPLPQGPSGPLSGMDGPLSVEGMADDAAALLRALGVRQTHVAGFSGGSKIAQELAIRHPELVRSLVLVSTWTRLGAFSDSVFGFFAWLADGAPSERAMLEAFYLWVYTGRAHGDGTVGQLVDGALAYPHPQSADAFRAQLDAFRRHDTSDRVGAISAPTLVISGGRDIMIPAHLGRAVAERIPGAEFVLLPEEAHQPFQERPEQFNALVDAFWQKVEQSPPS